MRWQDYIELNPQVMLGKPVLKGTRITVELIVDLLAHGSSEADILAAYPRLTEEHVRAARLYASRQEGDT
ncbi:MAG: DUF433 domain-containing protein [Planctomycetota bacterium]